MVIIDKCPGCGSLDSGVVAEKGYDFLICRACGNRLAILTDTDKPLQKESTSELFLNVYNQRIVAPSGVIYYGVVASGMVI